MYCKKQTEPHHKTTTIRHDHVYNNTSKRTQVRKSWRSGTSIVLPGWRCHTVGPRTPVLTSVRRLWVARYTETTEDRDTTTDEPDTLHKTCESHMVAEPGFEAESR